MKKLTLLFFIAILSISITGCNLSKDKQKSQNIKFDNNKFELSKINRVQDGNIQIQHYQKGLNTPNRKDFIVYKITNGGTPLEEAKKDQGTIKLHRNADTDLYYDKNKDIAIISFYIDDENKPELTVMKYYRDKDKVLSEIQYSQYEKFSPDQAEKLKSKLISKMKKYPAI